MKSKLKNRLFAISLLKNSNKAIVFFTVLVSVGTNAYAVTQAELDAMMSNVRSIVTDIGSPQEIKNFDSQMDEARQLRQQSEATQANTARIRTANAAAQVEAERQNARARFEEQSRQAQLKQDDLNRNPPRSPSQIQQHKRDECPSCR